MDCGVFVCICMYVCDVKTFAVHMVNERPVGVTGEQVCGFLYIL